jgi:hypothetical protein
MTQQTYNRLTFRLVSTEATAPTRRCMTGSTTNGRWENYCMQVNLCTSTIWFSRNSTKMAHFLWSLFQLQEKSGSFNTTSQAVHYTCTWSCITGYLTSAPQQSYYYKNFIYVYAQRSKCFIYFVYSQFLLHAVTEQYCLWYHQSKIKKKTKNHKQNNICNNEMHM